MSDFLVTLARRSAGLAPVVRARASAAAPGRPVDADVPAAGTRAHSIETPAIAASQPAPHPAPTAPDHPDRRASAAPAAAISIGAPASVQRLVASAAPPLSAPRAAAPISVPPPAARDVVIAPAHPIVPAAPPVETMATPRASASQPQSLEIAPVPAPASRQAPAGDPRADPPFAPAMDPRVERLTMVERIIQRPDDAGRDRGIAEVDPVLLPAFVAPPVALPSPREFEPAPERVVHVRIGAIEIHGAPAPASLPPAPAAPVPALPAVGDFDRFGRLRRYAPWDR